MADTIIKPCRCKSEFQDQQYGKGMRVHNINKNKDAKCTVCSGNRTAERMKKIAMAHIQAVHG